MYDPLKDVDPWEHVQERKSKAQTPIQEFLEVFSKPYAQSDIDEARPEEDYEQDWVLESGQTLYNVHSKWHCEGTACAIHNPSDHLLKDAPRTWKTDMIWRICNCGYEHPDFDSLAYLIDRHGRVFVQHDCCFNGCCGIPWTVDID